MREGPLASGPSHPGSIAITADDGYASQHRHLRPFLRELGVPWTVFVLAGMLGRRNDWDHPWISLRDWHLTPDEELARSREILRELSGQAVDSAASYLIPRLGLYGPDQLFPAFAAAAIGYSHPLRALRLGLERLGQGLVGLAMAAQARPRV